VYPLNIGIVIGANNLLQEVQESLRDLPVRIMLEQREIGDWSALIEKLIKAEPDILLVGLEQLSDPLEDVVRQIKSLHAPPKIIVVNDSADPATILRAIRADADEYLYPPLNADLRNALERMSSDIHRQRSGTRPRGKVFGFLAAKGGCGATTLGCHVAVELHRVTRLDVLLADFDLDTGIIGFLMKAHGRYSVLDAVANAHRLDLSFWKALVSNGTPGVEVIPAPPTAASGQLKNLNDVKQILPFVRSNYDWSVLDLGRGLTPLSMSLLEEVDETVLVTTLEVPALHNTKLIVRTLLDAGYATHRLRILLNRMPKRAEVTLEELDRMLGHPIFATIPNDYQALYEAYSDGGLLPAGSNLNRHFARIAAKLAGMEQKEKKHGFAALFR
jgi:pilus assembly protein CpaE